MIPEGALDVEAVHGMAPGAKIVFVAAEQPPGYRRGHESRGRPALRKSSRTLRLSTEFLPPGYILPLEATLIQAAIEGIGVYFSSGDQAMKP